MALASSTPAGWFLPALLTLLVAGAALTALLRDRHARWGASSAVVACLLLACAGAVGVDSTSTTSIDALHGFEWRQQWLPRFGIHLHLGADALSGSLVLLALVLGLLAIGASWDEPRPRQRLFYVNLLLVLAGVIGVFFALDLFLFYVFWELMLLPMTCLIAVWGHENRRRAAMKFFLFTQTGGLLMLAAILGLAWLHHDVAGKWSFALADLQRLQPVGSEGMLLMLGFFAAFAIKLPVVPFHGWLADAHTQAPTAGSILLAGLLLKTGAYGMIRFAIPMFLQPSALLAPVAMSLGVVGIFYGAFMACTQTDMKRVIAYSSVSHLGFVLLGLYARQPLAHDGAVLQLFCHGLSSAGLFIAAGVLGARTGTRDLFRLGGLWGLAPRLGSLVLVLVLASLGLPGLGNFVAEFLTLTGSFRSAPLLSALAALGFVSTALYSLRLFARTFFGRPSSGHGPVALVDASSRESILLGVAIVGLLWLGLFPTPFLNLAEDAQPWAWSHAGTVARLP